MAFRERHSQWSHLDVASLLSDAATSSPADFFIRKGNKPRWGLNTFSASRNIQNTAIVLEDPGKPMKPGR